MKNLEDNEIRGVSMKTLIRVVVQTAIICTTVIGTYYGIMDKLEKFNSHAQLQDLQIQTMQTKLDKMQTEIDINGVHIQGIMIDNERIKDKLGLPN